MPETGHEVRRVENMTGPVWLWVVFAVLAAAAQTVRNAAQKELASRLGTAGATQVRFLFGCPFAILFVVAMLGTGAALPHPTMAFWPWILLGTVAQLFATASMLAAMEERSFVVAIAYVKTEPVQVALFGLVVLGDAVTPMTAAAIAIATAGVIVMSMKAGSLGNLAASGWRAPLLGLASGAGFALSAIGYRGAILSLHDPDYVMAATFTVAAGLVVLSIMLGVWLVIRDRAVMTAILRAWRPSMFAGFMGALASQFWFLAFALTSAANVRTVGLAEVLFAQAVSVFTFRQRVSPREGAAIAAIIAGVVLLIWTS
jgi:drug/metabolite transporter (DMT)-like permease